MKTHFIKLNIEFCDEVLDGSKCFEIRKNDRGYQKGDHIKFISVDQYGLCVGHDIEDREYKITYVLNDWGLKEGYVALGIKELTE